MKKSTNIQQQTSIFLGAFLSSKGLQNITRHRFLLSALLLFCLGTTTASAAPSFSNLDGTPAFTENGDPVTLDADVSIADTSLDLLNSGNGNYDGASVSISRNGGTNADDVLAVPTGGNITVTGGPDGGGSISESGNTIATIANAGDDDEITISFTDANGTTPTTALVNEIIQAVTYQNSSDAPDSSVQLDWTFSDGANDDTGSTTVAITAVNDAPTWLLLGLDNTYNITDSGSLELNSPFNVATAVVDGT
ncbi:hypothetical protein MLD52_20055, partial [Puniceicoccaceae bacterium K14]|nr:hypothetical protein [Puniceicoccaceae bacterium K14]